METLATVLTCPLKDCWATPIDLKDAYLHVPIHPNDQKWLKFRVKDQTYMFRCLRFGLSTAPRVFTQIVKTVAAYLRLKGLNLCVYLDDWLIYSRSLVEALHHIKMVQETVTSLGSVINVKKSNFVPTQIPSFWGPSALIGGPGQALSGENYEHNTMRQDSQCRKSRSSRGLAKSVRTRGQSSRPGAELSYAYETNSAAPTGAFYRPSCHSVYRMVPMSELIRDKLKWWSTTANLNIGVRFPAPLPQLTMTTDGVEDGLGGSYSGSDGFGPVVPNGSQVSHQLVRTLGGRKNDPGVRRSVDGLQVHSAVGQFDGGSIHQQTRRYKYAPVVHAHSSLVEEVSPSRNVTQGYPHSRVTNILADDLSRGRGAGPTEWALSPQVVQTIFRVMFYPTVDLFASASNHQLPVYCSRMRDPRALAVDALHLNWRGMTAYAFPPISLLQRVIQKIASEDCNIILIAPFWPRHLWFRPW
ncbi:uncharacterized protein [Amphiura filiformis]|uniref:uncharacterized protein n=1 Tax=Amphiura filiformis TaxID=82378 RepID=UPI003B20C006